MTDDQDGVDPRVLEAKACDIPEQRKRNDQDGDSGDQLMDTRTYGRAMGLVAGGAVLMVIVGFIVPDRAVSLGIWTSAGVVAMVALVVYLAARYRRRRNSANSDLT